MTRWTMRALTALFAATTSAAALAAAAQATPASEAGQADPYAWLTDIHGSRALGWVAAQDKRSTALLKADPRYQRDYDAVLQLLDAQDRIPFATVDHGVAYNFWQDAAHPRGIWRRTTVADYANPQPHWQTLIDLDALDKAEGKDWVWKGAVCAPSGDRCLVQLSPGGGDAVTVREFDLKTAAFLPGGFTLPVAKTDVAYLDDDTLLFGTDFGPGSMTKSGYPRVVKMWRRGEPMAAARTLFTGNESDVADAATSFAGPYGHVAIVDQAIDFFHNIWFGLEPDGTLAKLPLPTGFTAVGVTRGQLIGSLREDWTPPGQPMLAKGSLIAFPVQDYLRTRRPQPVALLFAPGPRQSVDGTATGRDAVYASIYDNVIGSVHAFSPDASGHWRDTTLDLPQNGATGVVATDDWTPAYNVTYESFLTPTTLYAGEGTARPAAIKALPARFDASGLVTHQYEATSKDGTKIPYFVVERGGEPGPRPTILYGYGGFEVSMTPSYSGNTGRLWLTHGGTFVLANIRGGGEFGPAWHDAALTTHRQKAFDDFEAVAADLERRGITSPKQLGIMGGSNGGLLVSTVMIQRPDLLGAVVCQVPLIDMLTYTHFGAGASWISEYGDPADPRMAAYIRTYSPYQNVSADKRYPPVFFFTTTSDDRVTPIHARKMAAKMEAQGHDVLFFENLEGGHGAGATHTQAAEMWALSYVFLARELGLKD